LDATPQERPKEQHVSHQDNDETSDKVTGETTAAFRADFLGELDASAAAAEAGVRAIEGLPSGWAVVVVKRGPKGLRSLPRCGCEVLESTVHLTTTHAVMRNIMSKLTVKHRRRSLLPDISELFTGFPAWANLAPMIDTHLIRLEDEIEDGHYVIRAELPGIDPAKDVDITVTDGQLTIKAERSEKKQSKGRSEFSYGSFMRSVTLPAGADEDDITASYDKGILTVSVALPDAPPAEKHIAVQAGS
jgi:HSP20 family protein